MSCTCMLFDRRRAGAASAIASPRFRGKSRRVAAGIGVSYNGAGSYLQDAEGDIVNKTGTSRS